MALVRGEIIARGIRLQCPHCGAKSLFPPGSMRIHDRCPGCGLLLNRGEGFFLGPMVINYGIAVFGFVAPCILLWAAGILPALWAVILSVAGCVGLPIAFYRLSWSLWLMTFFVFLPDRLEARGDSLEHEVED